MSRALPCQVLLMAALVATPAAADVLRIAALVPAAAGVAREIPEQARVVAQVRTRPGTPPAGDVVDLGSPHSPELESLTLARPDVIVIDAHMHAALAEKLARTQVEILAIDTRSVASTLDGLVALGRRAGAEAQVRRAAERTRAELDALRLAEPIDTLTIFAAPGVPMVVTERTWAGDLLAQLGFSNAASGTEGRESFPGFVQLSDEALAGLEPDVLLVLAHGNPAETTAGMRRRLAREAAWRRIGRAVGERVYTLDPAHFRTNPGLDLPQAARALLEQLAAVGAPPQ
ncbi:MAG: ABC transporter substrate-binding protein [Proteobacteria bacterium]|nr:ABC transporter substrate-binding protein [Pseudomonadota bacterium]